MGSDLRFSRVFSGKRSELEDGFRLFREGSSAIVDLRRGNGIRAVARRTTAMKGRAIWAAEPANRSDAHRSSALRVSGRGALVPLPSDVPKCLRQFVVDSRELSARSS